MLKKVCLTITVLAINILAVDMLSMRGADPQAGLVSLLDNLNGKDIERLESRISLPLAGDNANCRFDVPIKILKQILGFRETECDEPKIKHNYKKLMFRFHPGRCKDPLAGAKTKILSLAYQMLLNNSAKVSRHLNNKFFGLAAEFVDILNRLKSDKLTLAEITMLKNCGLWNEINAAKTKYFTSQGLSDFAEKLASTYFANKYKPISYRYFDFGDGDIDIDELFKKYHENAEKWKKQRKLDKARWDLDIIIAMSLWDIFNVLKDLRKINVLGSHSPLKIKQAAKFNSAMNLLVNFCCGNYFKLLFLAIAAIDDEHNKNTLINNLKWLSFLPNIAELKFTVKDLEIIRNAEKLANYNKDIKRDLSKVKRKQYTWLAINKLAPYLGFALARKYNENNNIFDLFTKPKKLKDSSKCVFEVLRMVSNISEVLRKNSLYKAEMGNYRNYKPNQ